jgi:rhamnosyltransferase
MSTAITSGALLSLDAYREVGSFRAEYFIDSVDEEFCLRLRRHGMIVVCSRKPLMHHALGNARKHRLLGRDWPQSHHATFRRYYIARNRVLTLREFALREPRWAYTRMVAHVLEFFTVPLLESDRWAKLRAMIVGTWHGIIGRTGKLDRSF